MYFNDDKKLALLMGYLWSTRDYKVIGVIKDPASDLYLTLLRGTLSNTHTAAPALSLTGVVWWKARTSS